MEDSYYTIKSLSQGFYQDRGSKFYAFAYPILSEEEVKPILAELKKNHPKARHFCYAFKTKELQRAADDGEPSGSAGKPILNSILSIGLNQILVVVVRYFGGSLLGVPGLIQAYKSAASASLSNAQTYMVTPTSLLKINFAASDINEIMRFLKKHDLEIEKQFFTQEYTFHIAAPQHALQEILEELADMYFVRIQS